MQKEEEHAARVRAEDELAEVRGDLVASARALQAEREHSHALNQKVESSDNHVMMVRAEIDTVNAELGALKERLSSEVRPKKRKWRVVLGMVFIQCMGYCSAVVVSAG